MATRKKNKDTSVLMPAAVAAAAPFLGSAAMQEPFEEMSLADQVALYSVLDAVEKRAKRRRESLREVLLQTVQNGKPTEKGGTQLEVAGSRLLRERRVATVPDGAGVATLLRTANIDMAEAFDEVKTLQLNPSKLDFLVQKGALEKAAVDALHKVSYALRVQPSKLLKEALGAVSDGE
jgi:hypothetical protein